MKKIVAIGGGTGLSTLLRGLRDYPLEITAIVTMTDDGKSTGRLREDLGILPPGDIRNCIAALSEDETMLLQIFQHRFKKGIGLKGHSIGNLLISAVREMTGSFEKAVETISKLLSIKGQVLPSTLEDVHLSAIFSDGKRVVGETKITKYGYKQKIARLELTRNVKANPKAIKAIESADLIILGPGSLYTSIIPNFLITEITDAVNASASKKVYVSNISTERGETEGFNLGDHLNVLGKYKVKIDLVIANSQMPKEKSGDGFVFPVKVDKNKNIIKADLVSKDNVLFHDSKKLGKIIKKILEDKTSKKEALSKARDVLKFS